MSIILSLEPDVEYPPIYGLVSDLPPWKMCSKISQFLGFKLVHEGAIDKPIKPIQIIQGSILHAFDKFIWSGDEEDFQFIHLINNKINIVTERETQLTTGLLFAEDEPAKQSVYLLKEWNYVRYLIRTEGMEDFFNPHDLKFISGVRMVIKATIDQFKNYEKII